MLACIILFCLKLAVFPAGIALKHPQIDRFSAPLLQTQNMGIRMGASKNPALYRGTIDAFMRIAREEGVAGLYRLVGGGEGGCMIGFNSHEARGWFGPPRGQSPWRRRELSRGNGYMARVVRIWGPLVFLSHWALVFYHRAHRAI